MDKNKQITTLIESDIISSKLVNTFTDLGIDASLYLTDVSELVFDLIGIQERNRTEALYKKYFFFVNEGKRIDFSENKELLQELALDIQTYLLQFK